MRKYLLGIMLIGGLFQSAVAQSKFLLGPTAGLGFTTIKNTSKSNAKLGGNIGAALVYNASEHMSVGLDTKLSFEGEKTDLNNTNWIKNVNYLRIPLKAIYNFGTSDNIVRPKVFAGPSFGFLLGGKTKFETPDKDITVYKSKELYKSFDFGITAGAGLTYGLNENTWLDADLTYFNGITGVVKDTHARNRNIMLNVGVLFGL